VRHFDEEAGAMLPLKKNQNFLFIDQYGFLSTFLKQYKKLSYLAHPIFHRKVELATRALKHVLKTSVVVGFIW
jgi:hypothetical protein